MENPADWIKYRARVRRSARKRICDVSQNPPARSAFPALDRENVITDLINWTYGRRRTKCLALPPPSSRAARQPRRVTSEWTLFGDDNNGSVSIMSTGIVVGRIYARSRRFRKVILLYHRNRQRRSVRCSRLYNPFSPARPTTITIKSRQRTANSRANS